MIQILLVFPHDSHTDTVNTPLLGSPLTLFLASHTLSPHQHRYTRMQHVNICTLSDKLCVMLSLYMSTFFFMVPFLFLHFDFGLAMVPCTLH